MTSTEILWSIGPLFPLVSDVRREDVSTGEGGTYTRLLRPEICQRRPWQESWGQEILSSFYRPSILSSVLSPRRIHFYNK